MPREKCIPEKYQAWIDARRRFHLSDAHVQMGRELGLNPKKLGKMDNHRQEQWKVPLHEYIEHLYSKHFGRRLPAMVVSVEDRLKEETKKKAERRKRREEERKREGTET